MLEVQNAFTTDCVNLGYAGPGGFGGGPFGTGSLGAGGIPLTPGGAGTGYPSGGKNILPFLMCYSNKQ